MTETIKVQTRKNKAKPFLKNIQNRIDSLMAVPRRTKEDSIIVERLRYSITMLK